MKNPKYIIYDMDNGDYYLSFGDDYTDFIEEAYRYTNEELIENFNKSNSWLPKGIKLIQVYED